MTLPDHLVFRKTEKAALELRQRARGLNARIRQVLILLDGQRKISELARMLPDADVREHLVQLETDGFIARELGQGDAVVAVLPDPLDPGQPARAAMPIERARLVRALLDAVGPSGDDLATRIERCRTLDELRSLVQPAADIVEAVAGRDASDRFLARIGPL